MRRFVLLVLCSGCHLVIPLTEPIPAACGPYKTVTPVLFEDALAEPSDFSVHYNGTQGMVRARVATSPTTTYTGPVPIVLTDGVWKLDVARFPKGLPGLNLDGGHMLGDGSVFGWIDAVGSEVPKLNRYKFQGATPMWTLDGMELQLESDFTRNLRPGNEILLDAGAGGVLRFFPQIRIDFSGAMKRNQLVIRQRFVAMPWLATDQADTIARETYINPTSAVMTANHDILIYAASENGGTQQIFASVRDEEDQFTIGRPVVIDLAGEIDDSEPWIGETCATLYFRRAGVTYVAQ